jgi:hypothetical protein
MAADNQSFVEILPENEFLGDELAAFFGMRESKKISSDGSLMRNARDRAIRKAKTEP